jgi:hypothetical protein
MEKGAIPVRAPSSTVSCPKQKNVSVIWLWGVIISTRLRSSLCPYRQQPPPFLMGAGFRNNPSKEISCILLGKVNKRLKL